MAWVVSTIRGAGGSMREERAEIFSRKKCKARTAVDGGQKSLVCDLGSELRLGGRELKGEDKIMKKKEKKKKKERKRKEQKKREQQRKHRIPWNIGKYIN